MEASSGRRRWGDRRRSWLGALGLVVTLLAFGLLAQAGIERQSRRVEELGANQEPGEGGEGEEGG